MNSVHAGRKLLKHAAVMLRGRQYSVLVLWTEVAVDVRLVPGLGVPHAWESVEAPAVSKRGRMGEATVLSRVRPNRPNWPASRRTPLGPGGSRIVQVNDGLEAVRPSQLDLIVERSPIVGRIGGIGRIERGRARDRRDRLPARKDPDRRCASLAYTRESNRSVRSLDA